METLQWADGLLLVYSITDRNSFNFVRKAKEALAVADPEAAMPLALVGNKADMVHLRQVSGEEGEILAKDFECWFSEITAAEQVTEILLNIWSVSYNFLQTVTICVGCSSRGIFSRIMQRSSRS